MKLGEEAKFKVKASGGTVTYQWYYRTSEDGEWKVMSGETGTILIDTPAALGVFQNMMQ